MQDLSSMSLAIHVEYTRTNKILNSIVDQGFHMPLKATNTKINFKYKLPKNVEIIFFWHEGIMV